MKSSFKTALIAAVVSAVVAAGAAVATTQTFVLGATNHVNAPSNVTNVQSNSTVNPVDAPLLTLQNSSTTANATPLSLLAAPKHAPFRVNTQTRVDNLNSDQLDSHDSAYFLPKTGKAADSALFAGQLPSAFYHRQRSLSVATSDCVTQLQLWTACAEIPLTIPAGHIWAVTVISTLNGLSSATQTAAMCPAYDGPTCIDNTPDLTTLWGGAYTTWASSTTTYFVGPQTVHLNTAVKLGAALTASPNARTSTTALAYDATQESLQP